MIIVLTLIASLLLYSKSKYFPKYWSKWTAFTKGNLVIMRVLSYLLMAVAAYLAILDWGVFTGILIWLVVLMFAFSVVVIAFPAINWLIHKN